MNSIEYAGRSVLALIGVLVATGSALAAPAEQYIGAMSIGHPTAIAVYPEASRIYLANTTSTWEGPDVTNRIINSITVIDSGSNTVLSSIPLPGGGYTMAIVPDPVTNRLFVLSVPNSDTGEEWLYVINASTNAVVDTVPLGATHYDYLPALAVNPALHRVYALHSRNNSYPYSGGIYVLDAATHTVIGDIALPDNSSPEGLAVDTLNGRLYTTVGVSGGNRRDVAVIDVTTGAVIATVQMPEGLSVDTLAANPATHRVYATDSYDYSDPAKQGSIVVIDGNTNSVVTSVLLPPANGVSAIRVNSVTNQVFVAQYLWDNGSQTAVIDGATDTLLAPISTGRRPQDMAVDSVANRVYVVNDNASVSVLDAASGVRQTTISTGHSAISVATHAKANRVYTGNGDDTVSVFDSFASSLLTSVALPAGSGPVGLVVNSDANRLYTANALGATISVIDTSTNRLLQTSFAGGRPVGLALNPQTNRLYAANIDDSVSVINTVTNALVTLVALPAGSGPVGAAANPMTNFVYIANYGGSVSVLDGATNSVITNVALPADSCPTGVAVNPITNRVYTANRLGDSVTVIDGATNSVITTVQLPFGTEPLSVVVNTSTNRIYTCNHGIGLITVIDGATNAIVSMLGWSYSSYEGYGIALNETTGRLYTTMGAYNDVVDITQAASAGPAVVVSMTDSPKTNDTVTATAVSYGPPGDSLAMSYRWKRNDVTVRTVDSTASLTDSLDLSVPGAGDRGDTISVQVTPSAGSDTGLPASASVVVANTPPVAYARFVTTKPNTPVDVTPYVTDADNDPLTFSLTSLPSHGSLSGVATGSLWSHVVYSPYSGYSGPDAFAFYVADGTDSSQAIISINVTSSNLYTFTDVSTALRIAAGLSSIAPIDFIRFNADATGGSANSIDIADAVHLVRKVAGLEPNP